MAENLSVKNENLIVKKAHSCPKRISKKKTSKENKLSQIEYEVDFIYKVIFE